MEKEELEVSEGVVSQETYQAGGEGGEEVVLHLL